MSGKKSQVVGDTSCRHATLMRLLRQLGPDCDPRLALGGTADTRARRADDRVAFVDLIPALADSLAAHGFVLHCHQLRDRDDLDQALAVLSVGQPVAVDADTFHLAYYDLDYQRVHALPSLALEEFDAASATVRVVDAVDAVFFDERVALADLEPALLSGQGQTWWELSAADGAGLPIGPAPLRRHLSAHLPARVDELVGSVPGALSGVELAEYIAGRLGDYTGTAQRRDGGSGPDESRARAATNVMWNYHHTLRWLALFLDSVSERTQLPPATAAAECLADSAQDWLVARNLVMRTVVSDRTRLDRYTEKVSQRLWSAADHLRHGAAALHELQKVL